MGRLKVLSVATHLNKANRRITLTHKIVTEQQNPKTMSTTSLAENHKVLDQMIDDWGPISQVNNFTIQAAKRFRCACKAELILRAAAADSAAIEYSNSRKWEMPKAA